MKIGDALRVIGEGCHVSRMEWGDPETYLFTIIDNDICRIVISKTTKVSGPNQNGPIFWEPSDLDVLADDFYVTE